MDFVLQEKEIIKRKEKERKVLCFYPLIARAKKRGGGRLACGRKER